MIRVMSKLEELHPSGEEHNVRISGPTQLLKTTKLAAFKGRGGKIINVKIIDIPYFLT